MIGRVNGVGFAGLYGGTSALGWQSVKLPQGMTWKSYMEFLLGTLPEKTTGRVFAETLRQHKILA